MQITAIFVCSREVTEINVLLIVIIIFIYIWF